jgi:hypothetical protein
MPKKLTQDEECLEISKILLGLQIIICRNIKSPHKTI